MTRALACGIWVTTLGVASLAEHHAEACTCSGLPYVIQAQFEDGGVPTDYAFRVVEDPTDPGPPDGGPSWTLHEADGGAVSLLERIQPLVGATLRSLQPAAPLQPNTDYTLTHFTGYSSLPFRTGAGPGLSTPLSKPTLLRAGRVEMPRPTTCGDDGFIQYALGAETQAGSDVMVLAWVWPQGGAPGAFPSTFYPGFYRVALANGDLCAALFPNSTCSPLHGDPGAVNFCMQVQLENSAGIRSEKSEVVCGQPVPLEASAADGMAGCAAPGAPNPRSASTQCACAAAGRVAPQGLAFVVVLVGLARRRRVL